MPNPYAPSKVTVVLKHAHYLGPQPTMAHLLSHLGDKELFVPTREGDHLDWMSTLALFLLVSPQFTWADAMAELARPDAPRFWP